MKKTKLVCELTECPICGAKLQIRRTPLTADLIYGYALCNKCIKVIGSYTVKYDDRRTIMDKWFDMFGFGNMKCY